MDIWKMTGEEMLQTLKDMDAGMMAVNIKNKGKPVASIIVLNSEGITEKILNAVNEIYDEWAG